MIWKEKGLWEKNAAQRRFDLLLTWLAILTSFPVLGVDAGHVKWSTHAVPTPEASLSLPPTQRCAGKPEVNTSSLHPRSVPVSPGLPRAGNAQLRFTRCFGPARNALLRK